MEKPYLKLCFGNLRGCRAHPLNPPVVTWAHSYPALSATGTPTDTGHRLLHHRGFPGKSRISQNMPLGDDTLVNRFNPAHTNLLLGCTDFTQGFRHANLDFNPPPGHECIGNLYIRDLDDDDDDERSYFRGRNVPSGI